MNTEVKEKTLSFEAEELGIRQIEITDEASFATDAECVTACN